MDYLLKLHAPTRNLCMRYVSNKLVLFSVRGSVKHMFDIKLPPQRK
jgi:hypothetical protein